MSAGAAAILAMGVTFYLMVGLGWSVSVALIRLMLGERVTLGGFAAQWLGWPLAVVVSLRGPGV